MISFFRNYIFATNKEEIEIDTVVAYEENKKSVDIIKHW